MAGESEDAFQQELVELFVQEAHEWLQQVHVALDELQQGPAPDRHLKLAQTIKGGITNLAGSAATINLSDVERASFAALPFVEAVQDPAAAISVNDFIVLCRQLGHIHTALTRSTGVTFDESVAAPAESSPVTVSARDVLAALTSLPQSGGSHRNFIRTVIAQVQGLLQNGVAEYDVQAMREFLHLVDEAEGAFYASLKQQLPLVGERLVRLRALGLGAGLPSEDFEDLLHQVEQLTEAAQQVNAANATTFFKGLHSFLTVVLQQRVTIAAQRFEAVETRLNALLDTVRAWVDAGRAERDSIGQLFPTAT